MLEYDKGLLDKPRYDRKFSNEPVQSMPKLPYREITAMRKNANKRNTTRNASLLPVKKRKNSHIDESMPEPGSTNSASRFAIYSNGQPLKYNGLWSIPEPLYSGKRTPSAWKAGIRPLYDLRT